MRKGVFMMEKEDKEKINMDENWYREWISSAPKEDMELHDHLYDLGDYFSDMLFEEGSSTYELIKCQSQLNDGSLQDDTVVLPP